MQLFPEPWKPISAEKRPDAGRAGYSWAVRSETALWSQIAACLGERVMVYPYAPMGGHCLG